MTIQLTCEVFQAIIFMFKDGTMCRPNLQIIFLTIFSSVVIIGPDISADDLSLTPELVFTQDSPVLFVSENESDTQDIENVQNTITQCSYSSPECINTCNENCNNGCDNGCRCGCRSCSGSFLLNIDSILGSLITSDHEFDRFIEPVSNPVYFEDPRSRTRLRFLFINQMIPERSILGGGDFQVYGMEATIALSNRLSIIAQKDGYISLQADGLANEDGWADLATGLKYVLIRDVCNQFILSGGAVYEWSNGSSRVFQGNGDGNWSLFLTGGKEFGNFHFITTAGWRIPVDGAQESESIYHSHHLDYALTEKLYALVEYNGILYTESGSRLAVNVEGGDLINLGASNVAGNYFASMAFGSTYKFSKHLECAAAYEIPITGRKDLMDNRITSTISLIY